MQNRYDFIVTLARSAGEKVLELKDKPMDVSNKDNDPRNILTNVDIEVSEFISESIMDAFPGETIYSEEADADVSSGSFWSVDPVDGTANFARGLPHYSVVIAYVEKGQAVVGGRL
jgi:myo-inositol-1(or 4)-monophosphatase